MDTIIDLSYYINFISDLHYFGSALALVFPIFMLFEHFYAILGFFSEDVSIYKLLTK